MTTTPPADDPPMQTPCVRLCLVDGASGLCLGCFRTLAEIAGWSDLPRAERAALMEALPSRRDRIEAAKLARFRR